MTPTRPIALALVLAILAPTFCLPLRANNSTANLSSSPEQWKQAQATRRKNDAARARLFQAVEQLQKNWIDLRFRRPTSGQVSANDESNDNASISANHPDGSSASGSGGASNASSGSGKTGSQIGYDDNAKKGNAGPSANSAPSQQNPSGGPSGPPRKPPVYFDKWWPLCVFVDPGVPSETGNKMIKQMVDMAAACHVAVKVCPFTVTSPPNKDDPETINDLTRKSCDATKGLKVSKASATFIGTSTVAADKMCKSHKTENNKEVPTEDVAGCAELSSAGGETNDKMKEMNTAASGEHMSVGKDGVAVSIEDKEGWTGAVLSHESMGHSEMGWPNGENAGNGIGSPDDKNHSEQTNAAAAYNARGCGQMHSAALANDAKFAYEPDRKLYYVAETKVERQLKFGEPIWKDSPPSSPPQGPPHRRPSDAPGSSAGPSNPPPVSSGDGGAPESLPPPKSGGHRQGVNLGSGIGGAGGSFRGGSAGKSTSSESAGPAESPSVSGISEAPPESGTPSPGSSIGYDDSASKGGGSSERGLTDGSGIDPAGITGSGASSGRGANAAVEFSPSSQGGGSAGGNGGLFGDMGGSAGGGSSGGGRGPGSFGSSGDGKGADSGSDEFFQSFDKATTTGSDPRGKPRAPIDGTRRTPSSRTVGDVYQ